ncbi:ATP-dependent nuclease [Lacipirellula sp.]|uniref:ATP-dependent nuclease n=1 Tax=Lacipirellula sp. TaxID=2691419 RepID=UPI003D11BAF1
MRIHQVHIKNFRLLRNVEVTLEDNVTVIVGRNNSGKTSLTELFRRLLAERAPTFKLEDFSCAAHLEFIEAFRLKLSGGAQDKVREILPSIEVSLTVSYKEDTQLGLLGDFIVDLDPDCTDAKIVARYELDDGKLDTLFADLTLTDEGNPEEVAAFYAAMKERVQPLFRAKLHAADPNDPTNTKQLDWSTLTKLLRSGFINAQRSLDDTTHRDNDVLGGILNSLFEKAKSGLANEADQGAAEELDTAVERMRLQIDADINVNLKAITPAFSMFGYPGLTDPNLTTETSLDVTKLLQNHTKIRYAGSHGVSLPEAYNGLGARNLIYILLHLFEFFKAYQTESHSPGVQIIFIEEPEAHLHPQMAEVFIKQLSRIAKFFEVEYNDGEPWPVQFVVSTHSSHMANEARFEIIRYFLASPETDASHVRKTRIKDLRQGLKGTHQDDIEFLHQYMTLTRCDLFFADKASLIEGCAERLLFPKMIEKVDEGLTKKLSSQYVAVVEICGAYAHKFFDLLEFLELKTLIITDLDSVKKNDANKRVKCVVADGMFTSNGCVKTWFKDTDEDISPATLLAKADEDKTDGMIRLAYQIPETPGGPCGRSFEDAFMLANLNLFEITGEASTHALTAYDKAADENKAEFALKYAIKENNWKVPLYISQGLTWLAEVPSVTPIPVETASAASKSDTPKVSVKASKSAKGAGTPTKKPSGGKKRG